MWEANKPLLSVGSFGERCGCVHLIKMNSDNGSKLDYLTNDLCSIQRLGSTAITQRNYITRDRKCIIRFGNPMWT